MQIDYLQFSACLVGVLSRTAAGMTELEARNLQQTMFITMHFATETVAMLGHPVPGNDPRRPN
jgi:hypothetical protein